MRRVLAVAALLTVLLISLCLFALSTQVPVPKTRLIETFDNVREVHHLDDRGLSHGPAFYYAPSGKMRERRLYDHGKPVEVFRYSETGELLIHVQGHDACLLLMEMKGERTTSPDRSEELEPHIDGIDY